MSGRSYRVGLAVALWATVWAAPALGLIVVDGKIVPAWPADPLPTAPTGAALDATNIGLYAHPKGNVFGLTLLIDFSDAAPAFTKDDIDAWLNQKGYTQGGLNGSVRDYYLDESNGVVDFQNEIFGFYRAKQPKSHYESTSGYEGSDELFGELMDYFDPLIDFSKYDNDKDGRTDAISIVYAGEAVTFAKGLWPHSSSSNQKRDGVTIARYMMTNLGTALGLYTFCHEVGHMLFGWPDLYGFGNYCIMGNSSSQKNPVGINDFYRADQAWIPIVDVTKDTNAVYSAKNNGAGYRYTNPSKPQESFFWSNVQSSGRFSTISGDGLLLLHFDKSIGTNTPPNPLSLAVVQADGKKDLDQTMWPEPGSDANDFFRGGGVSEFSAAKFQTAKWNDGSASELHIYEVAAVSENMQFKVGNGPIVADPNAGGGASSAGTGGTTGGAAAMAGANAAGNGGASPATGGSSGPGTGGASAGTSAGGVTGPTSMAAGASTAAGSISAGSAPAEDGSCACRLPPLAKIDQSASRGRLASLLLTTLAIALVRRRRRRG